MKLPVKKVFHIYFLSILTALLLFGGYFALGTYSKVLAQCQVSNLNEGLISATKGFLGNTLFGNTEQVCITGTEGASYREFKVPDYQTLEDQFYNLSRSTAKKTTAPGPILAGDGIYLNNGNISVTTDITGSGVQVIFVRGDLNIASNITYADNDSNSGLVFIVRDNINIFDYVTKVNAVLISTKDICTAYNGTGCPQGVANSQLVINGSLISLSKDPNYGIKLSRNLLINNQPAEVVNKQAKYLYLLRNGILTKDLIITTEDQHYDISGIGDTPAPSIPPLPASPCTTNIANPSIVDLLEIPGCLYI